MENDGYDVTRADSGMCCGKNSSFKKMLGGKWEVADSQEMLPDRERERERAVAREEKPISVLTSSYPFNALSHTEMGFWPWKKCV